MLLPSPISAAALVFSFSPRLVTIRNVTPGSHVYGFSVAREHMGYYTAIVERETILTDSGLTGTVQWNLDKDFPLNSVWFASDLDGGAAGAAAEPGYPAMNVPFSEQNVVRNGAGQIVAVRATGNLVWFVVVRPHHGEWRRTVPDGGPIDEDGVQNNTVVIHTSQLVPTAGTTEPAPAVLQRGDVVFIHNSFAQTYSVGTVDAEVVASIPALSGASLFALALALASTGFFFLRRIS